MTLWEETSHRLDLLQADADCVRQEFRDLPNRKGAQYHLSFDPDIPIRVTMPRHPHDIPRVAILREEGTNGDREMAAAFLASGFQVWDVNSVDLIDGRIDINNFQGLVFCGGYSFAGKIQFSTKS